MEASSPDENSDAGTGTALFCQADSVHEALGVRLWWSSATPDQLPASTVFIKAYRERGISALDTLSCGATAIIQDLHKQRIYLAIDPMGIGTMSWLPTKDGIHFSDRPIQLARNNGITSISRQQVFNFLFFHMIPTPHSVFDGISKLCPATALEVSNGKWRLATYWHPDFSTTGFETREASKLLHNTLGAAVEHHCGQAEVGAFLSGGLDSSSVAGYLARVKNPARTFSIGFGVEGFDELEYARIANRHFGCHGNERVARPEDIIEHFTAIARAYDEPFGNSSVVPTLLCAQLAKQNGVTRLLAGDGGDELFAGNERYARQKIFEVYRLLPESIRGKLIRPIVNKISPESRITPLRKFRSYVDQASVALPRRFESWNFAYREGVSSMLDPEYAKDIDSEFPFQTMSSIYDATHGEHLVNRMLAYDWKFTLADSDIRKVSTMCQLAGIEVSYPMLDRKLVELSAHIPADVKLNGSQLRSFYKQAMEGFLPKEILNKPKHGFGLPFGIWLKENAELRAMITNRLTAIAQRGIFKPEFIELLLRPQASGAESYHGYFVWDLAILEEWLSVHGLSV